MTQDNRDALRFPHTQAQLLFPYLPSSHSPTKPFVTLTYATSLDSALALSPGTQTALSGPGSKAMTHHLRSQHDAILVGVGTAVADNPSLNCRIEGVGGYGGEGLIGQPRPIVIDPKGRWGGIAGSKVVKLAGEGRGKAPWVVVSSGAGEEMRRVVEGVGGRVLEVDGLDHGHGSSSFSWKVLLGEFARQGIQSVMIEGGGVVINELLSKENIALVDSVIVTIAPVWLGRGSVQVCPEERVEREKKVPVGRLEGVQWVPLGDDVVLCGRPKLE